MSYLDTSTVTIEAAWAELDAAGADPTAHVCADDTPGVSCVHLLGGSGHPVTFRGDTLPAAVRRALAAWRRAEVALARRRGLLPDAAELDALTPEAVRMACAAAMALNDLDAAR